tara:strand:+ start:1498 stop:3936 length:2439 start_codon:yes stop_codon:yes gene_type:complete
VISLDSMDDKFVLVGLDDEKSKYVAEVLGNKTCKKILNYLAEVSEASVSDVANGLNMQLNTVDYNVKKLVKAGLVERVKNFFWSVKGKKIGMYKLAKKHIIISPKNQKPSASALRAVLPVLVVLALAAILAVVLHFSDEPVQMISQGSDLEFKQFESYSELKDFVKDTEDRGGFFGGAIDMVMPTMAGNIMEAAAGTSKAAASGGGGAGDYSETNIQVEGVDEADIVKNDGKYIYVVSGQKVLIVDAFPAEDMEILSEIELEGYVSEIFINDDKLVVFMSGNYYGSGDSEVLVYDISDREKAVLDSEIEFDGSYVDSRMIGDYVYIISTKYVDRDNPEPPIFVIGSVEEKTAVEDVYYFDSPDNSYVFTSVLALDLDDGEFESETYLTGASRQVYVSEDNIYLTRTKWMEYKSQLEATVDEVYSKILPSEEMDKVQVIMNSDKSAYLKGREIQTVVSDYSDSLKGDDKADFDKELLEGLENLDIILQKRYEKTLIHKIGVDKMDIEYKGAGEVPGRILNQFSMDEYKGNFRIATTTGQVSRRSGSVSLNHLYILDDDLEVTGKVEDLAPGERIYSVRFMGKRAYVVTFKKVDPLFVIDVANPRNPKVLGYLKITGYSDYLHPYDEDHIIGIGKETAGGNEDFSWYQGVKISLFDVSDVSNPIEKAKIEIGDRGTESYALHDHHAFLFDKEGELLVIPVTLAEINESQYLDGDGDGKIPDNAYGMPMWQGAYVLNINSDDISLRGKISHDDFEEQIGRYYYAGQYAVQRSLYMDNYLYTVSQGVIKANDLVTIDEISKIDLGYEGGYGGGLIY